MSLCSVLRLGPVIIEPPKNTTERYVSALVGIKPAIEFQFVSEL